MKAPRLFMLVYTDEQPVRAVFHGAMRDEEMEAIADKLNVPDKEPIRLVILEKYKDHDDGYQYTILTLGCDDRDFLEERLAAVFPDARLVEAGSEHTLREIVRSIII